MVSFLRVTPPKPCGHHSSPPHLLHPQPIHLFAIRSLENFGQRYRSCSPSFCKLLQSPLESRHSSVRISSSAPYSQRPQPTLLAQRVTSSFTHIQKAQVLSPKTYRTLKYVVTSVGQGSVLRREGSVTKSLGSNIANIYGRGGGRWLSKRAGTRTG